MAVQLDRLARILFAEAHLTEAHFVSRAVCHLQKQLGVEAVCWNSISTTSDTQSTRAIAGKSRQSRVGELLTQSLDESPYRVPFDGVQIRERIRSDPSQVRQRLEKLFDIKAAHVIPVFVREVPLDGIQVRARIRLDQWAGRQQPEWGGRQQPEKLDDITAEYVASGFVRDPSSEPKVVAVAELVFGSKSAANQIDFGVLEELLSKTHTLAAQSSSSIATTSADHLFSLFDLPTFLDDLAEKIRDLVKCEGVTIFLPHGNQLRLGGTTGIEWKFLPGDQNECYRLGEGLTGAIWQRGNPCCIANAPSSPGFAGKSTEIVPTAHRHSCLWLPFRSTESEPMVALVRCRNRVPWEGAAWLSAFDDTDVHIVRAIMTATRPHLDLLVREESDKREIAFMSHDMRQTLDWLKEGLNTLGSIAEVKEKYSTDLRRAESEFALMRMVIRNSDVLRHWPKSVSLEKDQAHFWLDILKPAIDSLYAVLLGRRLPESTIIPSKRARECRSYIRVDVEAVELAVANLLHNAVIYHSEDRSRPAHVWVDIFDDGLKAFISVRDDGVGFPDGPAEQWFAPGRRGPEADLCEPARPGLGLWVTKRLIESHGGSVRIVKTANPTEVEISLPL